MRTRDRRRRRTYNETEDGEIVMEERESGESFTADGPQHVVKGMAELIWLILWVESVEFVVKSWTHADKRCPQ